MYDGVGAGKSGCVAVQQLCMCRRGPDETDDENGLHMQIVGVVLSPLTSSTGLHGREGGIGVSQSVSQMRVMQPPT